MTTAPIPLHPVLATVTERIRRRSAKSRADYLARMAQQRRDGRQRAGLGCANMAHTTAALPSDDRLRIHAERAPHIGVVTAYNDMLSAHQPFEHYPALIRDHARSIGATAQVAGGVPAMCDGITQGEAGMELSLFSRDVIALSTTVALSHNVFDAALLLGVCDKIVPGLLMGALGFGHLPVVFVPAGPMASGLSNDDKARVRQQYAQGLVGREALLQSEAQAYHSPGTCTFYGTANSNQMLMEIMGLHLPGASFVNPGTPLRDALTAEAVKRSVVNTGRTGAPAICMADIVTEKTIVNGIIGLLATGGSTNHTLHLVAMARAAGVLIDWDDFAELSHDIPLLARVYPNGSADVNHFHAAGGLGVLMRSLSGAGLLHADVTTVMGRGLDAYAMEPWLDGAGERIGLAPGWPACRHRARIEVDRGEASGQLVAELENVSKGFGDKTVVSKRQSLGISTAATDTGYSWDVLGSAVGLDLHLGDMNTRTLYSGIESANELIVATGGKAVEIGAKATGLPRHIYRVGVQYEVWW